MLEALVWDAGGTLFDSYPAVVDAALDAAAAFGGHPRRDWVRSLFHRSTHHALSALAAELGVDEAELEAHFETAYDGIGAEEQPPFPYVEDCCRFVIETGGRNFIVTHRGPASLARLLDAHGMRAYFSDLITKADPYPRKPNPASLLALIDRHQLDPARSMVVGDRELDVAAGSRAGMRTCFFGNGHHTTPVDIEIAGYDQLLAWMRRRLDG